MVTGTRSEAQATAAPAAAEPARKAPHALPEAVLWLQRSAGNSAVARTVAAPTSRVLQRCGAGCGCATCGPGHADDELFDEKFGAGLLRAAVAHRSG
jgi:hypothetical protein